jgi:O-methyltransferase
VSDPLSPGSDRYLDLLARCLTREVFVDEEWQPLSQRQVLGTLRRPSLWNRVREWRLMRPIKDRDARLRGEVWPANAETMVGLDRLVNVKECVVQAVVDGVPGDLVETGVWRGGTTIYLRAILEALGDTDRNVWVCDSFEGLPPPNTQRAPADSSSDLHEHDVLAVGEQQVRDNFARYGLLDDRVRFVRGWFKDTMPALAADIGPIAVLRFDGDMYEAATDVLTNLEPRVSPGGFVIIDDYHHIPACRQAVDDYRERAGITAPMTSADWNAAWWRKTMSG